MSNGDLISREALIDEIERDIDFERENNMPITAVNAFKIAIKRAKKLPSIDAVPVVHGRWREIKTYDEDGFYVFEYKCSACGCIEPFESGNYCSYCGAKMDKEESDALE